MDWLEISLVYDKRDKHLTIYDSYNAECAARLIKLVELATISENYSLANTKKYDTTNSTQKHILYKQFVAWHCNGCSIAMITDYINNSIHQELPTETEYYGTSSDERIYLDLRAAYGYTNEIEKLSRNDSKMTINIKMKNPLSKMMRLRVWGNTNGKYLYMLLDGGLTLKNKTYTIKSEEDELES